jgi:hypothetical protein
MIHRFDCSYEANAAGPDWDGIPTEVVQHAWEHRFEPYYFCEHCAAKLNWTLIANSDDYGALYDAERREGLHTPTQERTP